jgi:arsenite methyltransferase
MSGLNLTTAPPPWEEQVKAQVRRRYDRMAAENTFRPGAAERAVLAGYPQNKLNTLPPGVADTYSGCGYGLGGVDLTGVKLAIDLGCGAGLDTLLLAQDLPEDTQVIAIDLAPNMLQRVSERAGFIKGAATSLLASDMERLPLADAIADLVLANASLNLTTNKETAFKEIFRILRPDGRLVARDLVRTTDLDVELAQDPGTWNTSLGGVTLESELVDAAVQAGFDQLYISEHTPFGPVTAVKLEAIKTKEVL